MGDRKNRAAVAAPAGLEKALVEKVLATDEGLSEVAAEEKRFKATRIGGVPSFVVNGRFLFSGAAEP